MHIFTQRCLIQYWIGVLLTLMATISQTELLLWSIDARQGVAAQQNRAE